MILLTFLFTVIIEAIMLSLFVEWKLDRCFLNSFLINLISYPIVITLINLQINFIIAEIIVFLIEFILLSLFFKLKRAIFISFIINLTSALPSFLFYFFHK